MLMRFVGEVYYGKDVIKIIKKGIAKGGKHMSLSDKSLTRGRFVCHLSLFDDKRNVPLSPQTKRPLVTLSTTPSPCHSWGGKAF
jgi:hypothetical protein